LVSRGKYAPGHDGAQLAPSIRRCGGDNVSGALRGNLPAGVEPAEKFSAKISLNIPYSS
jgi:hypothetical protein